MNDFKTATFEQLNTTQLYQILALRSEVFVLEQNCAYQDMDGLDALTHHVWAETDEHLFAYARILPPVLHPDKHVSIGRVVVAETQRKDKWGKKLMQYAIDQAQLLFPNTIIEISAQTYLTHFYQNLGFANTGNFYLEDDIPHQTMVYRPVR
ncbi:GNAT family N-acetyltransferase [Marinicella rhabdoformis]|uniref:GNAT family N-acetyltransferase n=1 Tax=Marinicella rhabdoformis TaxID=2580566 RepID=UPI0012AEE00F|nr:GNAT family N-acetyltransferase [Marinicella rhabdoformis]